MESKKLLALLAVVVILIISLMAYPVEGRPNPNPKPNPKPVFWMALGVSYFFIGIPHVLCKHLYFFS